MRTRTRFFRPAAVAVIAAMGLGCAACGGGQAEPAAAPKPAPPKAQAPAFPDYGLPAGDVPLEGEETREIVDRVQAEWLPPPDDPLRAPSSLEDVEKILGLDQASLYPGAIFFLQRQRNSIKALALEAQMELAWGESYTILMEVLLRLSQRLDQFVYALESKPKLTADEQATHDRLLAGSASTARLAEAFQLLAGGHISRGSEKALEVIEKAPNDYVGYRIAADYYRTVREWDPFDAMVAKIEERNPNSNGLVFLRGAAAFQRDRDVASAEELFGIALQNDPAFVRVQAHRVLIHDDLGEMWTAFQKLRELNPNHPVVRWAGPIFDIVRFYGR